MTALPDLPDPVCEGNIHIHGPFGPAPTATLWAGMHGCEGVFLCSGCLGLIGEGFAKHAPIKCAQCGESFTCAADYLTWREL